MVNQLRSGVLGLLLVCTAAIAGWMSAPPIFAGAPPGEDPELQAGPALPEGLASDPRLTWHPRLNPTATVTVDGADVVTVWRSGSPVIVPTNGRDGLTVAAEQLANNAGEWVGITGQHGSLKLGDKTATSDASRTAGFQGISFVGLDNDPSSSSRAVLGGFALHQRIGQQRDIAFLNLTIDSWTDRPCQTMDGPSAIVGHLYVERVRCLGVDNGNRGTAKGDRSTKWFFKEHGPWTLHFLEVEAEDGVDVGDGEGGENEHFVYSDGCLADAEFVDVRVRGAKISALYFASRYVNRVFLPGGGYVERYAKGTLLIENVFAHDCGVLGSAAVNVCGGLQRVVIRNPHYRVNLDGYTYGGAVPTKWAGKFLQVYVDHKQFELDYSVPVNSNSVPIALGYSMEPPGGALPESVGADLMGLPKDGYGGAREVVVEGGLYECGNLYPPLMSFRDVGLVSIVQSAEGVVPFTTRGVGKAAEFAAGGRSTQCGPAQAAGQPPGRIPPSLGTGWNQQARFLSRKNPSVWFGKVGVDGVTLQPAELDTWVWRN